MPKTALQQTLARAFEALLCLAVIYESAPAYWYVSLDAAAKELCLPALEELDSAKHIRPGESFGAILGGGAGASALGGKLV